MKRILLAGLVLPAAVLVCACGGTATRRTEPEPTAKRASYEVLSEGLGPNFRTEEILVEPKATKAEILALAEWLRWYHNTHDGGYRHILIWDSGRAFAMDREYTERCARFKLTPAEERDWNEAQTHCLVEMVADEGRRDGHPEIQWVGPADHP